MTHSTGRILGERKLFAFLQGIILLVFIRKTKCTHETFTVLKHYFSMWCVHPVVNNSRISPLNCLIQSLLCCHHKPGIWYRSVPLVAETLPVCLWLRTDEPQCVGLIKLVCLITETPYGIVARKLKQNNKAYWGMFKLKCI